MCAWLGCTLPLSAMRNLGKVSTLYIWEIQSVALCQVQRAWPENSNTSTNSNTSDKVQGSLSHVGIVAFLDVHLVFPWDVQFASTCHGQSSMFPENMAEPSSSCLKVYLNLPGKHVPRAFLFCVVRRRRGRDAG